MIRDELLRITPDPIPALLPRGKGHQFLVYSDSCSGVPYALHERTFASVYAVVRRLDPQPEFILFPGDEIIGLVPDATTLREQWRHWFEAEMGWLDRTRTPVWHTTGNHTTYDIMSERVFREVLKLPENGPPGQLGLSYFVRRGDLLMVFRQHPLEWSRRGRLHRNTMARKRPKREFGRPLQTCSGSSSCLPGQWVFGPISAGARSRTRGRFLGYFSQRGGTCLFVQPHTRI